MEQPSDPDLERGLILLNPLVRNGSTSSAGVLDRRDGPVGCMNRGRAPMGLIAPASRYLSLCV